MTIKEIKRSGLEAFKSDQWSNVGTNVVYSLVTGAVSGTGIGALICNGPLEAGYTGYLLKKQRKEEAKLANVFDGFSNTLGNNIVTWVLKSVYLVLWSLLLFIPGLIKGLAYSMTFYIMQDNPELSGNEAITASRKLMNGNKWKLFCLYLSFIGWFLLGILTFGILIILYVGPRFSHTLAAFYESIKQEA